jgi:ribosomal-protein-alanine N-acetyltransferase
VTFREAGYGVWLAFGEGSGAAVGFAGLLGPVPPSVVVGMKPQLWGQGLATEAAQAVLDHTFRTLGLAEVLADVDEPNVKSIRLLERLGMQLKKRAVVEERPLLYYALTKEPGE